MRFTTLLRRAQFHGAIRLAEKRCRCWWSLAMSLLFGCSLAVIWVTVKRFIDNPTYIVQVETIHTVMPFPSVLVCPEIMFGEDKMDHFIYYSKFPPELNASYIRTVLRQLAAFYAPDVMYITRDLEILEYLLDYNDLDVDAASRLLVTSCEETLIRCRWNGTIVNCSSLFQMQLTGYGYCCVFNGRSLKREMLEYGIHVETPENKYYTNLFGFTSGLMLVINQTQKLHNVDLSYKWLALQGNQDFVESTVNGTALSPGSEQWASYRTHGFQIADDARSLSKQLRHCRMANEPLRYFPFYHKEHCLLECEMLRTMQRCRCARVTHPRPPGVTYCRARNLLCAKHAKVSLSTEECDCPPACDVDAELVTTSSFDLMPHVRPFDNFYEDLDFKKVTIVRAFIQNAKTKINSRWSYFNSIDLFSQLGGVFNVFFGVSILTIFELIQLARHGLFMNGRIKTKPKLILPSQAENKPKAISDNMTGLKFMK